MDGRIGKSGALGKLVPAVVGISLVCAVGCGRKSDPPPDRIETRVGAEHASNGVPFGQSRVTVTFHQYWFDEGIQGDGDDRDMWAEVEFAGSDFYDDLEPGCCSGVLSPGAFPRPSSYSVSRLVNNETNNPLGMGIAMYENDGGQLNNRSPDDDLQNIQPGESNNVTNIDVNLRTGTFSGEQSPDRCDEDGCFACTRSTVSPNDDGLCFTVKVENNCTGHTEPCDIVCVPISTTDMTCDGRDDDCNGQIDDGYAPRAIVCGAGLCQGGGLTACLPGNSPDNHEETPPCPTRPAVCATSDFTCDSCDDNCNGAADEGFPTQTAACGPPGACAGTVTTSCTGGQIVQSGCLGISAPIPERPDGVDNDCDGQTDECTAADWWCACTPGVDVTFHVDLADDGVDPDTEAELCLPGALATGSCRLRGVFRRAEQLQFRGCRVIAQLDARPYHVDDELRLGRGNLLLQGTQRELSVITTTSACADAACNALNCPDRGCGPTCSHGVLHRLINAIADPGAAPGLELRSLTLRGGRIEETANFGPTTASGGVVLTRGQLVLADAIVRDNRSRGHGAGVAVYDAAALRILDSVIRDNRNEQSLSSSSACHPNADGGGATADGGGVFARNTTNVEITRSAIVNNMTADGGGMALYGSGAATITNSTFTGNEAAGRGGALLANMSTVLQFTTIVGNVAGSPGSVRVDGESGAGIRIEEAGQGLPPTQFAAFGNIIAGNMLFGGGSTHAADCALLPGTVVNPVSVGLNLIGSGGLDCAALGDPAADPLIGQAGGLVPPGTGPLPTGGPISSTTQVLELVSGLAIGGYAAAGQQNPGAPSCPVDDQRQLLRPAAAPCSLGAYEVNALANPDGDGIDTLVDTLPAVFSNNFSDVELFGVTTGTIVDRAGHLVTVRDAASLTDGVVVAVRVDGGTTPARISACNGSVQLSIPPGQTRTVTCPRPTSCVFSGQALTLFDRARVTSDLFAGSFTFNIDSRLQGNLRSSGSGFLFDRATITGDATLRGVLTGNRAGVLGRLTERANVTAQSLLARGGTGGTGTIEVPSGGSRTLSPGAHGQVLVRAGATLALASSGIYRFTSLVFESDSRLNLLGANSQAVVAVDGNLTVGDRFRMGTGTTTPLAPGQVLFYTNGQNVLYGHDSVVVGSVEARNARVEVQARSSVTGCVGGRTLIIGQDVHMSAL